MRVKVPDIWSAYSTPVKQIIKSAPDIAGSGVFLSLQAATDKTAHAAMTIRMQYCTLLYFIGYVISIRSVTASLYALLKHLLQPLFQTTNLLLHTVWHG